MTDEILNYNQLTEENAQLMAEVNDLKISLELARIIIADLQRGQSDAIGRDQFMFNRGVRFSAYGSGRESITTAMEKATDAWNIFKRWSS